MTDLLSMVTQAYIDAQQGKPLYPTEIQLPQVKPHQLQPSILDRLDEIERNIDQLQAMINNTNAILARVNR